MFDGLFKLAHAGQYYQAIAEAKVAAHAVWQVIDAVSHSRDLFPIAYLS